MKTKTKKMQKSKQKKNMKEWKKRKYFYTTNIISFFVLYNDNYLKFELWGNMEKKNLKTKEQNSLESNLTYLNITKQTRKIKIIIIEKRESSKKNSFQAYLWNV